MKSYKYLTTPHLTFSPGVSRRDKVLANANHLDDKDVVITVKKDGENSSLYRDGTHARSLDSRHHVGRDWLRAYHATFAHDIPEGWRICGENLYAQHSLAYDDLPSYFMAFSVWNEQNVSLPWDDTKEFLSLLGIETVPEVYRGPFSDALVKDLVKKLDTEKEEGLVVRLSGAIRYEDFGISMAKWVRKGHVQTDEHWMHQKVIPNGLLSQKTDANRERQHG